jgi:uncharacterized membrane protein YdjX (TVP38/TMEM64 family)
MNDQHAKERRGIPFGRRLVLFIVILGLGGATYYMGIRFDIGFESLKENRELLLNWRNEHFLLAALTFIGTYCAMAALSLPFGFWLSLAGGFMFGALQGSLFIVCGATAGATLIFLAARYLFADYFHARAGNLVHKMEAGFQANALSYLLALRFIPFFPFWAVNLVPALLGIPLRTYVIGTFIGIIPGCLVFSSLGAGLGTLIEAGEMPDPRVMSQPEIALPLIGLAVLALIPVFYKKYKRRGLGAARSVEVPTETNS